MCTPLKTQKKRNVLAWAAVLTAAALFATAVFADRLPDLALRSAALVLNGARTASSASSDAVPASASANPSSRPQSVSSDAPAAEPSSAASSPSPQDEAHRVEEVDLSQGGNLVYGGVRIKSKSASEFDIAALLAQPVELAVQQTSEPQVLIYHTHTSEAYMDDYTGYYDDSFAVRTTDASHSVVTVGDAITRKLNAAGIVTIHDTQVYDTPYRGAYDRSMVTVEKLLRQYPTIRVTLDVHRDCLQQSSGKRLKPTAEINGRKAAQIMLVSGCDDDGSLNFPDWRKNMCFSVHLQDILAQKFPGLARPIYCWNVQYNEAVTPTSLLVEFGTEANTDEEVAYSGELFAESLIELMNAYRK